MKTTVYWNDAKRTTPTGLQTILVVYEDSVWCGVYANGIISLYPEDFSSVKLTDCDFWAAMPALPIG